MSLIDKLKNEPKFRQDQIYRAWFSTGMVSYTAITTLPKNLRIALQDEPWTTVKLQIMQRSELDGTQKALLTLADGAGIETVLMGRKNKRATRESDQRYTICISSQVGCPMGCVFCATGKMGFKRNLTAREIVDQVRFWIDYLKREEPATTSGGQGIQNKFLGQAISNIVLMGQGEPLLNYDNVKLALNIILKYAEMGPRQITVSTVGVPAVMEKMVVDPEWPPVRFALSLHNPIEEERKKLIPSHQKDFLKFLVEWSKTYHARFNSRTQFIGLEYTIVPGENDSERHLKAMIKFASKLGKVRINLIPLNTTTAISPRVSLAPTTTKLRSNSNIRFAPINDPLDTPIEHWHHRLMDCGFTTTIRRSQGQDIAAACGQLALGQAKG
ncbi:MAG: 23S rRNA (adenine(2503)-C(2))-methyltransferase RlmN [Candidatus Magasanikbacteria bacterium]